MKKPPLVLTLVLLLGSFFCQQSSAEMRIFELKHQPADRLADMVRSLVSPEARVASSDHTMMVNASPAELAEIARLVNSYDQASRMLRVTVEQGRQETENSREIAASGRVLHGSSAVTLGERDHRAQNSLSVHSGRSRVSVQGQDLASRQNHQVSQFLTVMNGSPARISVGRAVPFTSQMRSYCRHHPEFVESVTYQRVDTGFEVLPRVQGDMVQLQIRPFLSLLDPKKPGQIVFQELTTQVQVPLGTWQDLAGQLSTRNDLSREILGFNSTTASSRNTFRLRVDPQK